MVMKKHELNILPDMLKGEYTRLESNILLNGYNKKFPIYLYEGDIIDGWQRYQICEKHNIIPIYETFEGTTIEAFKFILQTNERRSLTSSQWAAYANEATEIINALEKEAKDRIKVTQFKSKDDSDTATRKNSVTTKGETVEKLAEIFPTNSKYIQQAKRIKKESPEDFEKIKSGEKTISQIRKEHSPVKFKDNTNPFFYETSKLLGKAFDHLERILQKEHIPTTKRDFAHIDSINHELYRLVRLAGQAGVDIKEVWEKMAGRHGIEIEVPEHLKRPSELED